MYRLKRGRQQQEQAKTRTSLICIPRSLSVSDNMTRVGRKKLTIQEPACTAKAWATTTRTSQNKNKPNMYTSFSKRERQYDPCRAKEINNPGTRMYRKSVGENKHEQAKTRTSLICIPRSLSVSNNMTRVGRKKLTIQEPACTVG